MSKAEIPLIKISDKAIGTENKEWNRKEMCDMVREACETHGYFCLVYDKFPTSLSQEMVLNMKSLFDLPEETKKKYVSPKPYCSYLGKCPKVPIYESFGIDDASNLDVAQTFTYLMWPDGNPSFCETLNSMSSKMLELNFLLLKMILESFGVERYYDSYVEDNCTVFRLMKYKIPPNGEDSAIGLLAHTDKNALTILCQNEVQGLEVQSKGGDWIQVIVPQDAFVVIVGDTLKAWSNGRLHAARHRVVISGDKDRYSCGMFLVPKEETVIEVPQELVDQNHPLVYRPFNYADYFSYFISNLTDDAHDWDLNNRDALKVYAGI